MNLNEFLRDNFRAFQQPQFWLDKAVNLRRSARTLYTATRPDIRRYEAAWREASKKIDLSDKKTVPIKCREPEVLPIFLLYGFALENALKALIVSRDATLIDPNRISKKLLKHDLVELAQLAEIKLSTHEKSTLEWCSHVTVWGGRYQVPREVSQLGTFLVLDHAVGAHVNRAIQTVEDVFDRVSKIVREDLPKSRPRFSVLVRV